MRFVAVFSIGVLLAVLANFIASVIAHRRRMRRIAAPDRTLEDLFDSYDLHETNRPPRRVTRIPPPPHPVTTNHSPPTTHH